MKVANKLVNTLTALSFGGATFVTIPVANAADLRPGYQQQADNYIQTSENSCDETLHHMTLRATEAKNTATGNSPWGDFPMFFSSKEVGADVELGHVQSTYTSGQSSCTSTKAVKVYDRRATKSLSDLAVELAGSTATLINGPARFINNLTGGNQIQSPTINGSTAGVGPVTVTTGPVTANGGNALAMQAQQQAQKQGQNQGQSLKNNVSVKNDVNFKTEIKGEQPKKPSPDKCKPCGASNGGSGRGNSTPNGPRG